MFSKSILIGYQNESTLSQIVNDIKHNKSKEIAKEVLESENIELDSDIARNYFGTDNFCLDYINIFPIKTIAEFCEDCKKGIDTLIEETRRWRYDNVIRYIPELTYEDFIAGNIKEEQKSALPSFYVSELDKWIKSDDVKDKFMHSKSSVAAMLHNINNDINEDNLEEYLNNGKIDYIVKIANKLEEKNNIYNEFCDTNLKKFTELLDKQKQYKSELQKKYFIKFVEQHKDLLSDEDIKKFDEEKLNTYPSFHGIEGLKIFFGSSFGYTRGISYFDQKNDDILSNPESGEYLKKTIEEARVQYFKYKGLDLGDNYEDYINNPKCQEIWPSQELINKLEDSSNNYEDLLNKDFYFELPFYKEVIDKINKMELLDKDSVFQPSNFVQKVMCVMPNIIQDENGYSLCPQVLIYSDDSEYLDGCIIHELNHLYELSLLNVTDGKYETICGWDYLEGEYNQNVASLDDTTELNKNKRKYELFNEIINEKIAQDITKMMHDKGVFLFCDPNKYKNSGGTSYEHSAFLINDFFKEYHDAIIKSRSNNNINIIWDAVGKENFDALNDLFYEFNKLFSGFAFYGLIDDLNKKKDTEQVRAFNEIRAKRDAILNNMREYNNSIKIFNM